MTRPFLSIIFPVHNEEKRLPGTLARTLRFLDAQDYRAEVVVVENGSSDRTLELARQAATGEARLCVIHEDAAGKGLAVRRGMLEAEGEYRFFADVDLSMPIEEISRFIPPALPQLDVAIASREAPGAVRHDEPHYRHFIGRGFNTLVRRAVLPGLQDSQCGFKCFRGAVADEVFPLQTIDGWTFDVEVLVAARRRGYSIVEIPIHWYFFPGSKIRVWRDSVHMALDLLTIRRNVRKGLYDRTRQSSTDAGI